MASAEHLEILSGGVDRWNAWRRKSPGIRPDLSNAQPTGKHGVDDPYDLYLQNVDFRLADLRRVCFVDALLLGAKFRHSDLSGAIFKSCNIAESSFVETTLLGTQFLGCDFGNIDFAKATIGNALFVATDLSSVKNLSAVTHKFPSSVSVDTLERTAHGLMTQQSNTEQVIEFLGATGVPREYLAIVRQKASASNAS